MTQEHIRLALEILGASGVLASLLATALPQGWRITHWLSWWAVNIRKLPKGTTPNGQESQAPSEGR